MPGVSSKPVKPGDLTKEEKDSWQTPRWFFNWLDARFHFDVDVAATELNALCRMFFTNAFAIKRWADYGRTFWCNPPYSELYAWIHLCLEQSRMGCTVVMLLPTHKGESWWQDLIIGIASEVWLLAGRMVFLHPVTFQKCKQAPFGSAVIVFEGQNYSPDFPQRATTLFGKRIVDIGRQWNKQAIRPAPKRRIKKSGSCSDEDPKPPKRRLVVIP